MPVEVRGCEGLDGADVERELGAELVGNDATSGVLAVEIACPRPDRGVVTVRRAGAPPSTRTLALADVEADARPRVLALVIAEALPAGGVTVAREAPPPRARFAFEGRGALRAFTRGGTLLWGGELGVAFGRLALAAVATGTSSSDAIGTVRPWVIDAAASLRIFCLRGAAAELCACARVEAGVAFASAVSANRAVAASTVGAPYFQAGGALAAAVGPVVVELGAGWAQGLVVKADAREAARLAGPVLMLALGARLSP